MQSENGFVGLAEQDVYQEQTRIFHLILLEGNIDALCVREKETLRTGNNRCCEELVLLEEEFGILLLVCAV